MKVIWQMQSSLTNNLLLQSGPGGHSFFLSELNRDYLPKPRGLTVLCALEL